MEFAVRSVVLCLVLAYATAEVGIGCTNQAVYRDDNVLVTLRCQTTDATVGSSQIQWFEYGTNGNGVQISDQTLLFPSHPNFLRYSLNTTSPGQYDLIIIGPILNDGTYYQCRDNAAVLPAVRQLGCQIVVLDNDPICTTTINSTIIVEGVSYTAECILGFNASQGVRPLMTWTGPDPFIPAITYGNGTVWSGIRFTAQRTMQAGSFTCRTNFTSSGFIGPDSDNTIPPYDVVNRTNQLIINWGPKNMRIDPDLPAYEVGTTITGVVDALPAPAYLWMGMSGPALDQNFRATTQSFQIPASLVGNNTFRFNAQNTINGVLYTSDIFPVIYVNAIPTTPSPGPSTTTTQAPARANCNDLTGKWTATNPDAILCINIDYTQNGVIGGVFKNGTDTFYSTIYGRIKVNTFDQGGFTVITSQGTGVFSFVLECQSCFGVETMIVSSIQNSASSIASCGSTGVSNVIPDYTFFKASPSPICIG